MDEIRSIWKMDLSLTPQMNEEERRTALSGWHKAVSRSLRWIEEDKA